MTIKKKITLSNIMMVLIPILFTAMVITICLHTSLGSYWYTLESMYSDENGIQFAQSMIYTYQQELWENNWGQEGREDVSYGIRRSDEMNHLEGELSGMGYHFMIEKNGCEIYSNLSVEDMETAVELVGNAIHMAKTLTASRGEVSVIKNTFYHGEKVFCIVAVHRQQADQGVVHYLQDYILKYVYGILIFFVVLTVLVNGILSWWISKSILRPLNLLSLGTREIREGNLDARMEYDKKDEFGQVCRDFDEMRAYLKESVEQRLKDEKRRRELITGISHDLRTPLTTIRGYLDGLMEGIADTPQKQMRYLQAIRIRTGNMVSLVESLSEYSRLGQGFRYHLEKTDLKSYVEQYLQQMKSDMEHNQMEMEFQCSMNICLVRLDREEFKRVLDNLCNNTVKYRIKQKSRVLLTLKRTMEGEEVELAYQDDGPGVPQESLERIFDSFYRVDDSRNQTEKGSGIGLAVVREIIDGHGGSVRAENRDGLAVIIHLPEYKEE